MHVAAMVLAAGDSTRTGAGANKAYAVVDGLPLAAHSLRTLAGDESVVRLLLVIRPEDRVVAAAAVAAAGVGIEVELVEGGPTRQQSEAAGLREIESAIEAGGIDMVAIHDAARPFFTRALWDRLLRRADEWGGAVPALDAGLLYPCEGELVGGPGRTTAVRVQTPQVFRAVPLLGAYRVAAGAAVGADDTAEVVERFSSLVVAAVDGEEGNRKITFADDLAPSRST
jgi:2-C-methyl-D-erythritol 4-phosphate cytidylyltransferase